MKMFKQFKYKLLPVLLVIVLVLPLMFTPIKAHATSLIFQYPLSWSIEDYYGLSGEEIAYQAFLYDLNTAKKCNGWNWENVYSLVIRSGGWIGVLLGTGPIYCTDTDGVYQTGDTLRFYVNGTGTHIYADGGIFNASYGLASWDKFTITIGTQDIIYCSHDIYDKNGNVLFVRSTPLDDGKDDESDSNIPSYDHNYSPKNEIIDDGYEFGSTLENIQTETLVTADEEPNVFLRVFKNISIMVSNSGKYIQALYEEIVHALDYFFNEIIPEIIYMTLHDIRETLFGIFDFIDSFFEKIKEVLLSVFLTIWNHEIVAGISLNSIWEYFRDIFIEIRDILSDLVSGEVSAGELIISALPDQLEQIIAAVWNSGCENGEFSIKSFFDFWFIPEDNFFETTFYELKNSREGLFEVFEIMDYIKSGLLGVESTAPVIRIPGGTYGFLTIPDIELGFSWYEKWKPFTDPLIAAFLYVTYAWHLILQIPGILSGSAGTVASGNHYESNEIRRENNERLRGR